MSVFKEREAQAHPAYNDGLKQAAKLAGLDSTGKSYTVYWDGKAVYVQAPGTEAPPNSHVVCIAQKWDMSTVQLRFAGARSEWVRI
jgi:hypothetical protein